MECIVANARELILDLLSIRGHHRLMVAIMA
jgi:hypothetical protein